MSIVRALLEEWDHEVQNTKKMLEAVPDGVDEFKPHEKSMSLGRLAAHIAEIPEWMAPALRAPELDWATLQYTPPMWPGAAQNAAKYAANAAAAREILASAEEAGLAEPWTMRNGDRVIFTLPKAAVLRNFIFNHTVHHRAQLGVYLRMLGAKVPGMYGPSADEAM